MKEEKGFLYHEGKKYARVSSITASDFSHIPAEVLENKQKIGTLIHQAIDDNIKGELPYIPPAYIGYYASYRNWREKVKPDFIQTEKRYFDDELMITGCIDCLAFYPYENVPTIIDWKTSASESPSWILQGHLYGYLVRKSCPISNRFLFIKLDKLGMFPKIFEYTYHDDVHTFTINLAKRFWQEKKRECHLLSQSDSIDA